MSLIPRHFLLEPVGGHGCQFHDGPTFRAEYARPLRIEFRSELKCLIRAERDRLAIKVDPQHLENPSPSRVNDIHRDDHAVVPPPRIRVPVARLGAGV